VDGLAAVAVKLDRWKHRGALHANSIERVSIEAQRLED